MERVSRDLLQRYKKSTGKKVNKTWEEAEEFASYVGLKTLFVLKLFRLYGKEKVLGLKSWLKDAPNDPKKFPGLVVWKLKQKND